MAAKKDLDPRFEPRFQRGFDGKVEPVATAPLSSAQVVAAAPGEKQTASDATPAESEPVTTPAASPAIATAASADLEPLRRFNPFRLALLLASLTALGFAAWLMWQSVDNLLLQYGGGTDPWMQFVAQLTYVMPGPLVTGGLLGFVLWLGVGVVAPRRRREHE